jgi:hypothetical protein
MRIERHRLRRGYGHLGRRVPVRHVDGPGAILASESRIPSQQPPARLFLGAALLVPAIAAIASTNYGESKCDGGEQFGQTGSGGHASAETRRILVVEGEERIMRRAESRLCGHCGPSVASERERPCREVVRTVQSCVDHVQLHDAWSAEPRHVKAEVRQVTVGMRRTRASQLIRAHAQRQRL